MCAQMTSVSSSPFAAQSECPYAMMLTPVERKRLRDAGRDAFYRQFGKQRDDSLERNAKQQKGENARRRDLDNWKRTECSQRFQSLPRSEQLELLPEYEAYHRDEDARERAPDVEMCADDPVSAKENLPSRRRRGRRLGKFSTASNWSTNKMIRDIFEGLNARKSGATEIANFLVLLLRKAASMYPGLADELQTLGLSMSCRCRDLATVLSELSQNLPSRDRKVRTAFVQSVQKGGFKNRRSAKQFGIHISRRVWRTASTTHKPVSRLGRPRIRDDPAVVDLVKSSALRNSVETSKFMLVPSQNAKSKEAEAVPWQCSFLLWLFHGVLYARDRYSAT